MFSALIGTFPPSSTKGILFEAFRLRYKRKIHVVSDRRSLQLHALPQDGLDEFYDVSSDFLFLEHQAKEKSSYM